jgi:hypothetical protein
MGRARRGRKAIVARGHAAYGDHNLKNAFITPAVKVKNRSQRVLISYKYYITLRGHQQGPRRQ